MVIGAAVTLLLGGVGAMSLGASLRSNRFQDAMEERWARAAEQMGGQLEVVTRKTLEPRVLRIVVELDDVEAVAALAVPVAGDGLAHTVVRAGYVLATGPRFVASPRTVGSSPQEGVPLALRADDVDAAASVFTEEASAMCDRLPRATTITGRAHEIEIVWDGAEASADVLAHMVRLAAVLARFGADHLRGLSSLDDANYEARSDDGPRVRFRRGLVEVFVFVRAERDVPFYVARTKARAGTPEVDVQIDADGAPKGSLPEGLIEPRLAPEMPRVSPARLSSDGEQVELIWSEAPTLEQTKAAVRVLSEIGADAGSQGAFR